MLNKCYYIGNRAIYEIVLWGLLNWAITYDLERPSKVLSENKYSLLLRSTIHSPGDLLIQIQNMR